jgi:hypothetical protein
MDKLTSILDKITSTIINLDRDYILKVSESDLITNLKEQYFIPPIVLKKEEKWIEHSEDIDILRADYPHEFLLKDGLPRYSKGTEILVSIPFEGDAQLLQYHGTSYSMNPPEARVIDDRILISVQFFPLASREEKVLENVTKQIESTISTIEKNIGWINKDVSSFNDGLSQFIQEKVQKRKEKILRDERIVAALNIPLKRTEAGKTFEIPNLKQKISLKMPETGKEKFEPEPTISNETYTSILKIIQNMIIAMERSPSTFSKLSEEELRDHILVYLNGIFEGLATGETFNGYGKTDILIRYNGKNIFIAECKFWNGEKSFLSAIDQLLSYTSWRDTKTAIILFNKTKNFSDILTKVECAVLKHKNCKQLLQKESDSNFRYLFHHNDDRNKELFLSILAFEIPKK